MDQRNRNNNIGSRRTSFPSRTPSTARKRKPRRKKKSAAPVIVIVAFAVILALLWIINGFRIEIEFQGEAPLERVSFGGSYTAPEAKAFLKGRLIFRDGIEVETEQSGKVDVNNVGSYTLVWKASKLWYSAEKTLKVEVIDDAPPVITLVPDEREYVLPDGNYDDPGYSAYDAQDGDVTENVKVEIRDDGVAYTVTDSAGNRASAFREVLFKDPEAPVITLEGGAFLTLTAGKDEYKEPGFSATDNLDGDVTEKVEIEGSVDVSKPGLYRLTYRVSDSYGNVAEAVRTVTVAAEPNSSITDENSKFIYLTFDDGPGTYTAELLDILAKYQVKVTFFVTSLGDHTLIKREKDEGHSVGVHTYSHRYDIVYASDEAFLEDLTKINEIVKAQTGSYTYLLRFPGGSSNTISHDNAGIMTRLAKKVQEMGYQYFDWNVDSGDAVSKPKKENIIEAVKAGCSKKKNSVVLMHDVKRETVDAIEDIIVWGLENGYTFLPLNMSSPTAHHKIYN